MTESSVTFRRKVLRLVRKYPGIHLRELARAADTSEALAAYHLDALQAQGMVVAEADGNLRRLYATGEEFPSPRERELLETLRQAVPMQIALLILDGAKPTQADLAHALALARSTISYHVTKLVQVGLLTQDPVTGILAIQAPQEVEATILKWEPTPALADRFHTLWRNFYRQRGATRPGRP